MKKNRLEAFSDGVIAIIITIMVLGIKIPNGASLAALKPVLPVLLSYILSFIYVGIYWNNHHHLFQLVEKVNGRILWANLFLLFCLSLFPFATGWMGENHISQWPVALYGCVAFLCAFAWYILAHIIIAVHGKDSALAKAYGKDIKGKMSGLLYIVGIALSFIYPWMGIALFAIVAIIWFIPDKRIEKAIK